MTTNSIGEETIDLKKIISKFRKKCTKTLRWNVKRFIIPKNSVDNAKM